MPTFLGYVKEGIEMHWKRPMKGLLEKRLKKAHRSDDLMNCILIQKLLGFSL